jgi:hypothetical protein
MVVYMFFASVYMGKESHILPLSFFFDKEEICWDDIEILGIELDEGFEVYSANTVVTKLFRVSLSLRIVSI